MGLQEEERPPFARRTYYTRPIWIIGMILIVLGAIGDFEALGYAFVQQIIELLYICSYIY